jgi:hypothetical protein
MSTSSSQMANPATVPVALATVNASLFTRVYVDWDSFALSLVMMKHREWEIPGVTDEIFGPETGDEDLVVLSTWGWRMMYEVCG